MKSVMSKVQIQAAKTFVNDWYKLVNEINWCVHRRSDICFNPKKEKLPNIRTLKSAAVKMILTQSDVMKLEMEDELQDALLGNL